MVKTKSLFFTFLLLTFSLSTNSCFMAFNNLIYSSDVDERRKEMNNLDYVKSLPPLNTGGGNYSFIVLTDTHFEDGNLRKNFPI